MDKEDIVWDRIGALQNALKERAHGQFEAEKRKLNENYAWARQFTINADCALKKLINWKELESGLERLCRNTEALPFIPPYVSAFLGFIFTWIIIGILIGSTFGFILAIAAGVLAYKLSTAINIRQLQKTIVVRLMRFHEVADNTEYPLSFVVLYHNPKNGFTGPQLLSYAENTVRIPDSGYGIGIFKGEVLYGFLSIDSSGIQLFTFDGKQKLSLKDSVVGSGIKEMINQDGMAFHLFQQFEDAQDSSHPSLELAPLKSAWEKVVLDLETLENLLRAELLFVYQDSAAPKGILLKGPPGTGKSLTAKIFGDSSGAHFIKLSVAHIKSDVIGGTAANVKKLWEEARANVPSVIFIDECESIFSKRGGDQGDSFVNEAVQTFLTEWDGIGSSSQVLVIGATNRAELLDDAIMSRFADVIELNPVGIDDKEKLVMTIAHDVGLGVAIPDEIIQSLGGLSGREIRNAMQQAIRMAAPKQPELSHFHKALDKTRVKSSTTVASDASWGTLVLPGTIKERLKAMVEMIRKSESLHASGIPIPKTLLLYGPPGTGKTQIARTLANESKINFMARTTADLKGQYLGHAAARIAQTFETARSSSPTILFLDEIDAISSARDGNNDQLQSEAVTQLLQELDGVSAHSGYVLVIAATNIPSQLDPAILSRFAQKIEIPLPALEERKSIFMNLLANRPVDSALDIESLANQSAGLSGRDLRELVTEGFNLAVQRTIAAGQAVEKTFLAAQDMQQALMQKAV